MQKQGVSLLCELGKDGRGVAVFGSDDDRDSGLDYASFLKCDFFERIAEIGAMLKTDVGDYAQDRGDYVGRVEPSSKAGLDYCDVDLLFCKEVECHGGGYLEE